MALKQIRILVVDDLLDTAESTAELLSLWGYEASACDSGATALACARVHRPAAVLLDLAMPLMDGFAFARAFHALTGCGTVPLIALTGYSSPVYGGRAREAGIGHYLLKPAAPERLRAVLVSVTQGAAIGPVGRVESRRGPSQRQSAPAGLALVCQF